MSKKIFKNLGYIMILGIIIKIIGLITKIIITRTIKTEGLALYSLVTPTIGLLLTITGLSLPISINKYVAKNRTKQNYSNRGVILKCFLLSMIVTIILSSLFFFNINFFIQKLYQNQDLYYPLLWSIPLLYLASFSNILKGYLTGIKKQELVVTNQLIETIVKLLIVILISFFCIKCTAIEVVTAIIISISLSEIASIIHLLFEVKKYTRFSFKLNKEFEHSIKPVVKESVNLTFTRLVSSICLFFEPILFTKALFSIGLKNDVISKSYGIIEGYTLNLLFFTTFIIYSLCSYIIPYITENYHTKNYEKIKKILNNIFFIVCFIAGISIIIVKIYSKEIMMLLYNTTEGTNFIEYMAFFFILAYFTPIFVSINQSINNMTQIFFINLFSVIIRLSLIYKLCSNPYINVHGLNLSTIAAIIFNFIFMYLLIRDVYRFKIKKIILYVISLVLLYGTSLLLNKLIPFYLINIFILLVLYSLAYFIYYKKNQSRLFLFN